MALKSYFWGKSGALFWLNVLLAVGFLAALPFAGLYALNYYTRHGEQIVVPNVVKVNAQEARKRIRARGLDVVVADSNYVARLKPGTVLVQSPKAGEKVKSGRVIYLTVNRNGMAPARMPDLIRNTTVRIAEEQLKQLGFHLTPTKFVDDEPKDLVVGIKQGTSNVYGGDMVPRDRALTILAGAGFLEDSVVVDSFEMITTGGYDVLL